MNENAKWIRVVYIIGVIAFIVGTLDPLEGSVVILAGIAMLTLSTYFKDDKHWKLFLPAFLMIGVGVFFLFYLSSLGGFGGESSLSWWWGALILPYPIGWLMTVVLLIVRAVKKKKEKAVV